MLRDLFTLARWLGPWAAERDAPRVGMTADGQRVAVLCRAVFIDRAGGSPFPAWVYTPAHHDPQGACLLAPGLHYAGPADPRMDRFCAILAASGQLVLAPFLPDFNELRVTARVIEDFAAAFDALLALPDHPRGRAPSVFSISFGSLPALRLAASARGREHLGGLMVFGGYFDFASTIRFCLTGEIEARHGDSSDVSGKRPPTRDPLNQPVVLMNVLEALDVPPDDRAVLRLWWRRYVKATWGRAELKRRGRYREVAERLARDAPARIREMFLIGCGVLPGAKELVDGVLDGWYRENSHLDPAPYLERIRCPVDLFHGVDDDVIPYQQALDLREALPPATQPRLYLTGLYGHTAAERQRDLPFLADLARLPQLVRELATMGGMLATLARGGQRR